MISLKSTFFLIPILLTPSFALHAGAIDLMDNASGFFNFTVVESISGLNFDNPAGYSLPTATENGDGTVTLADTDTHSDTNEEIVDWTMPGGVSDPYMDLSSNQFLHLNLTSVDTGRLYDANILFFGPGSSNPTFLTEVAWLDDADGTNLNPSLDVTSLAPGGASQYFVRFRLLPSNEAGDVLTFDSISTESTPEPGTAWLGIGGVCFLGVLRLRRSHRIPAQTAV